MATSHYNTPMHDMYYCRKNMTPWLRLTEKPRFVCVQFGYSSVLGDSKVDLLCVSNLQDDKSKMEGWWAALVVS